MRLTIINQFYTPDHSPTAALSASLAEHRAAQGDEVTVIAGKGGYTGGDVAAAGAAASSANVRVLRVWTPGLGKGNHLKRVIDYAAFYVFALWRLLTLPRQDVIVSLTTPPLIAWAGLLHKRLRRRTRLILWNMDCYPDLAVRSGVLKPRGFITRLAQALNRAIFRQLDHLVCLDNAMAELLCEQYASSQPDLPVTILPNWEEAALFPRDPAFAPWPGWAELGIDDRFIVLYLGNMGYGHAFDTVRDAAEALREAPVQFVFIGGGKRAAEIEDLRAARNLENIVVRGYVPKAETGPVMIGAGCALVTLRDEIKGIMSPSKIHSNLAMGLPLIYIGPEGTNVDDAIQAHGCGVSLRHGDVEGLVSFVRRMMDDAEARASFRSKARAAFEAAYCDTAALPRFDAIIGHALSRTSRDETVPDGTAADYAVPPARARTSGAAHPEQALEEAAS
jgi:colanic acid biosynthesis glycosyl transferase WcaI